MDNWPTITIKVHHHWDQLCLPDIPLLYTHWVRTVDYHLIVNFAVLSICIQIIVNGFIKCFPNNECCGFFFLFPLFLHFINHNFLSIFFDKVNSCAAQQNHFYLDSACQRLARICRAPSVVVSLPRYWYVSQANPSLEGGAPSELERYYTAPAVANSGDATSNRYLILPHVCLGKPIHKYTS